MKKHSKRYIEKPTPLSNWLRWYRFGMGVDSGGVDPFIIAETAKTLDFNQYISSNGLVDNYAVLRDCILINKPKKRHRNQQKSKDEYPSYASQRTDKGFFNVTIRRS